ncbi:hypothetical protein V2J09_021785 [Rumex salicifolius]
MTTDLRPKTVVDPFLLQYSESELRIASEFLANWLPFLSKDLCPRCTRTLSDRVNSLSSAFDSTEGSLNTEDNDSCLNKKDENYDAHSLGSWKDEAEDGADGRSDPASADHADSSLGDLAPDWLSVESSAQKKSWADMAQEDELEGEEESGVHKQSDDGSQSSEQKELVLRRKPELSRDQREYLRFMNVKRKKDFICLERINGKIVNILKGLELHTGVFSAVEQKRIVKGKKGELKERTFTAPKKWMRGKGRETIQFGCCYNYATDKHGNPPGILRNNVVDPIPSLFKVIIRRLVKWHVIPPSCVPDSCIVNIYNEGDCIPPHIDNHDFVRPFCTISFLSECEIVFGTELMVVGPGDFTGAYSIPLPVGSVLVLNENGADVAKHCVPAVPSKRISITFRRMDENKRPNGYVPEPDLQDLQPLSYEAETTETSTSSPHQHTSRQMNKRGLKPEQRRYEEPQYSSNSQHGRSRGFRTRVLFDG